MWWALGGTALGWAATVIAFLWQLGRVRRELAQSRGQVELLQAEVVKLRDHVDYQVSLIQTMYESWKEDRERLTKTLEHARRSNQEALEALRAVISDPSAAPAAIRALADGVLSQGPRSSTPAEAPPAGEAGAVPGGTRPATDGPAR